MSIPHWCSQSPLPLTHIPLFEVGQPDWVIQAQIGHVSPQMMKTYSHIRRMALDEAAAVLEPTFEFKKADAAPTSSDSGATPT